PLSSLSSRSATAAPSPSGGAVASFLQAGARTRDSRQSVSVVRIMAPFYHGASAGSPRDLSLQAGDARSRAPIMSSWTGETHARWLKARDDSRHGSGSFPREQAMALELSLEDIRRAWDSRDPDLSTLIVSLAGAADPRPDKPPREGALTYASFTQHLQSWKFTRSKP